MSETSLKKFNDFLKFELLFYIISNFQNYQFWRELRNYE